MKRLFNRVDRVVDELLEGLVTLHPGFRKLTDHAVIVRSDWDSATGRVALISGGGSGHEPAHAGYVGPGMLTAAVAGDVFTSPAVDAVLAAIQAVGGPAGVLLIIKNYTGDRLNFGLAAELARAEGIPVEMVIVADDVAIPQTDATTAGPRGLAGTVFIHKVAGAAAESGAGLAEVAAEARAAAGLVKTMGVALTPCTVPAAGKPGFSLGDDEVELGLGIHGEPGFRRAAVEPADALVGRLLEPILAAQPQNEKRVALLVNGLGGTTPMELAIVARSALAQLAQAGLTVERAYAGTFLSALEMGGVSLSVLDLDDARLARLDAPTLAPAWPNAAPRSRPEPPPQVASEQGSTTGGTNPIEPQTELGQQFKAAIVRAARALIADADRLTDLDQAVGDGDLGISLTRGSEAVLAALPTWPLDDPAATFRVLANTLRKSLGGSSGPFYAVGCLRAAAAFELATAGRNEPNAADKASSGNDMGQGSSGAEVPGRNEPNASVAAERNEPNRWVAAFRAAIAGIEGLGGARAGDRTMLDALIPAADALAAALAAGQPWPQVGQAAAEAARAGAQATAQLTPRRGRSSYLGDRALGHPDPGAEAVATWLQAVSEPG